MPVFNAEKYVSTAIESILNQSYKNLELIIIDDKSKDSSWEITQQYAKKYPDTIKAIQVEKNLNKEGDACFNKALQFATGEYVGRMDADDIAYPSRIQKQVDFLKANPKIFMVGSEAEIINSRGTLTGYKSLPSDPKEILQAYFSVHPIIHPTILFRRNTKKKQFYIEKFADSNDYYTFFTLQMKGKKFANIKEPLIQYRIHGKNATYRNMKRKLWHTLVIRWEMISQYGYKPTLKQWFSYIVQFGVCALLPETLLRMIYIYVRGLKKPERIVYNKNYGKKIYATA